MVGPGEGTDGEKALVKMIAAWEAADDAASAMQQAEESGSKRIKFAAPPEPLMERFLIRRFTSKTSQQSALRGFGHRYFC